MARITREEYQRSSGSHGPIMLNVRATPLDGHKPTAREIRAAISYATNNGAAPDGWRVYGVEWSSGINYEAGDFRQGDLDDLNSIGAAVLAVLDFVEPKVERRTRVVTGTIERYRHVKTGRFVKASHRRRYPHLSYPVTYDYEYEAEWWEGEIGVDYGGD